MTETTMEIPQVEGLPEIDMGLLIDLISWAEVTSGERQDDRIRQWAEMRRLGDWDQTVDGAATDTEGIIYGTDEDRNSARLDQQVVDLDVYEGVCQTAHCIAGGAAVAVGYKLVYSVIEVTHGEDCAYATTCVPGRWVTDQFGRPMFERDGEEVSIRQVAQEALGLTHNEAAFLFKSSNTLGDLKGLANIYSLRRGLTSPYPGCWPDPFLTEVFTTEQFA